ncbi:hypothetical protein C0J52_02212 [Blattella germanica]|nr:hypothetical protein C0J52_02212 [Blattella germanica]
MNVLVITYLTIQFAVLSDSLKNIEENVQAVLERGGSQFVTQGQCRLEDDWHGNREVVIQNEAFHLEIERYLRCCIKHHQKLLQFFEVLNNVLRTTLFVDILVASVLISMLSFSFLISSDFSNVIQNIGILYFITIELWFFCWIGTRLSTQERTSFRIAPSRASPLGRELASNQATSKLKLQNRTTSEIKQRNWTTSDSKHRNRTAREIKLQNQTASVTELQNRTCQRFKTVEHNPQRVQNEESDQQRIQTAESDHQRYKTAELDHQRKKPQNRTKAV